MTMETDPNSPSSSMDLRWMSHVNKSYIDHYSSDGWEDKRRQENQEVLVVLRFEWRKAPRIYLIVTVGVQARYCAAATSAAFDKQNQTTDVKSKGFLLKLAKNRTCFSHVTNVKEKKFKGGSFKPDFCLIINGQGKPKRIPLHLWCFRKTYKLAS